MTSKRSYSISDRRVIGLLCGIVAGISYGTNPLFAKPLLESGVPVLVMLFFRYALSATLLGIWMVLNGEKLSTSRRELVEVRVPDFDGVKEVALLEDRGD